MGINIDLKNALDSVFWDLSDDSYISKLLRTLEDGVYDELIQTVKDTYLNMFPIRAKNMGFFSSVFPIYSRVNKFTPPFYNPPTETGFEYFKMKVISIWMGTVTAPTYEMLNWIAGGYSLQPCFISRVGDVLERSWWVGNSYLDGAVIPDIYGEPRTWLRSAFSATADIMVTLFSDGVNQLANEEEFSELKNLYRRLYGPYDILYDLKVTREPDGFFLWSSNFGDTSKPNGFGDFDLSSFINMTKEKEYYVINQGASTAGFETPERILPQGTYEFNCFEIILSNRIERIFEYSLDGGNTWNIIKPLGRIVLNTPKSIKFRMTINLIRDRILYRFISMMLRRLEGITPEGTGIIIEHY